MNFRIELAGKVIEIKSIYDAIYNMCRDYLTEKPCDFSVEISQKDIDFERDKSNRENHIEGRTTEEFSDRYLETLAVYRKIADIMPQFDTVLIHGSCIDINDDGVIFLAKSGVGKTTHTRLWLKNLPNCRVINGDKPLVYSSDNKTIVFGTPWSGKENMNINASSTLKAVVLLERGTDNEICKISALEAFAILTQQTYFSQDSDVNKRTLAVLQNIMNTTSLYRLKCNMNDDAALVAYKGIFK